MDQAGPRFVGFPKAGPKFLGDLRMNNYRQWFEEHRAVYDTAVKEPLLAFIRDLGAAFREFAPNIVADPRVNGSMYRIYRDTRFSKVKVPYKTHAAAVFWPDGAGEHDAAGYYFQFDEKEYLAGGGVYMPEPEAVQRIRRAMVAKPGAFTAIVEALAFRRTFGKVDGERLKRPPKGFDPAHPLIEYLKLKQFLVMTSGPITAAFHTRAFLGTVAKTFRTMAPFVAYLNGALGLEPGLRRARYRESLG